MPTRNLGLPFGSYSRYLDHRIPNITVPALLPGQQGPLLEASLWREDKEAWVPNPGPGGRCLHGVCRTGGTGVQVSSLQVWETDVGRRRWGKTMGQASGAGFPCSDIFCRWLWRIFRLFHQAWLSRLSWRYSVKVGGWHTFHLMISLISAEIET